jgi:hypothetical protein
MKLTLQSTFGFAVFLTGLGLTTSAPTIAQQVTGVPGHPVPRPPSMGNRFHRRHRISVA